MSESTGPAPPAPPTTYTARQLVQAIRDNFVVVSSAVVVLGVGLATVFLAAYLSVFDWHLLWFVQYSDILTFGLIALAIVSGSLIFLQSCVQTLINLFKFDAQSRRRWAIGLLLFLVLIVGFQVWGSVRAGEGFNHIFFGALVIAIGVVVILQIIGYTSTGSLPNSVQLFWLGSLLITTAVCGGEWLGYSVLEAGKPMDMRLKDRTMDGVKLVIVMSRHTIVLKERDIYVVPTADIAQFHRTALPWEF